ncbi:MAG: pantetheine-phosphate adenylyltransferase [Chloroflexi bacterium]|nr:pantetheine-phosphate adenylyltransferase [Chloroflexota bacterium]
MTIAVYPGAFDPITNGHMDIANRAAAIFDQLIVAVYARPSKDLLFTTQERMEMAQKTFRNVPNITVESYDQLTVDYVRNRGGQVIVRGLRVVSDFELEFQMALMNRKLAPDLDVVCLITSLEHSFLGSGIVKEVAMLGGAIEPFVPPHVAQALQAKFAKLGKASNDKVPIVSLGTA